MVKALNFSNATQTILRRLNTFEKITKDNPDLKDRVRQDLTRSLRDSDLLIAALDAELGDEIILTIDNKASFDDLPRSLNIRGARWSPGGLVLSGA